jgi:hypothetical protein
MTSTPEKKKDVPLTPPDSEQRLNTKGSDEKNKESNKGLCSGGIFSFLNVFAYFKDKDEKTQKEISQFQINEKKTELHSINANQIQETEKKNKNKNKSTNSLVDLSKIQKNEKTQQVKAIGTNHNKKPRGSKNFKGDILSQQKIDDISKKDIQCKADNYFDIYKYLKAN